MADTKQDGAVSLINLVTARLKEEWPDHQIGSFHYKISSMSDTREYDNIFVDHVPLGEVTDTAVMIWIPSMDGHQVSELATYYAADPKFFQHVCGTIKMILQRHQDAADDALRGAKYFKQYYGR